MNTLSQVLAWVHLDGKPTCRQPSIVRVALALVASIVGSLAVDAALVVLGTRIFPTIKGYGHFQFADYGKLTVVGVVVAGVGWPIIVQLSSAPRWLYFRLAIVVTIVLLLPDVWIWHMGQPAKAVAVLMLMHLAIAVVTYNCMIHLARADPIPVDH